MISDRWLPVRNVGGVAIPQYALCELRPGLAQTPDVPGVRLAQTGATGALGVAAYSFGATAAGHLILDEVTPLLTVGAVAALDVLQPSATPGYAEAGFAAPCALAATVDVDGTVRALLAGIPTAVPEPVVPGGANDAHSLRGTALANPLTPMTGQVLTYAGSAWAPATPDAPGMANPMTAAGDLIVGGASGTPMALPLGSNTQVLTVAGGAVAWANPTGGGATAAGLPVRLGSVTTPPTSWTWLNPGSAAITSEPYGERLALPADASTSFHVRYLTAPATPYTLTACLYLDALGANTSTCVLIWGDNSDLLETYGLYAEAGSMALRGQRWSSPTGWGGDDVGYNWSDHVMWLQLADDGTNRKVRVSHTGEAGTFVEVLNKTRTSHLTPTRLGWAGSVATSKLATGYLLSWLVT